MMFFEWHQAFIIGNLINIYQNFMPIFFWFSAVNVYFCNANSDYNADYNNVSLNFFKDPYAFLTRLYSHSLFPD